MAGERSLIKAFDWQAIGLYLVLVVLGWVNLYGAIYDFDQSTIMSLDNRAGKQFLWILGAFGIALVLSVVEAKYYNIFSYAIYIITIGILLITPIIAKETKGSLSWIDLGGGVKIQPAELAKISTAMALAKFMSSYGYKVRSLRDLLIPALIMLAPMLIIMGPQKETGSALVFVSFLLMFYREGMNGNILLAGVVAILMFVSVVAWGTEPLGVYGGSLGFVICTGIVALIQVIFARKLTGRFRESLILLSIHGLMTLIGLVLAQNAGLNLNIAGIISIVIGCIYMAYLALSTYRRTFWVLIAVSLLSIGYVFSCDYLFHHMLRPHQRDRIMVTLNLKEDPSGVGYNVNQSQIAIGSGGFFGKGYLNGTQTKLKYVPEQDTDFIFCTIGEEFGFFGSLIVLLLYAWFILRLIAIAERQRDAYNRIYGYCVAGVFFFHLTINIGMVTGLLPVIGIPLPFFSYGGSSLWGFTILLFIFLRLDASRAESY